MDRRSFILSSAKFLSGLALSSVPGCQAGGTKELPFTGSIVGPSYNLGHRLLEGGFPAIGQERKVSVVIVGGGNIRAFGRVEVEESRGPGF